MSEQLFFQIFEGAVACFETFIIYLYLNGLFLKRFSSVPPFLYYLAFGTGFAALSICLPLSIWLILCCTAGVFVLSRTLYQTTAAGRIIAAVFFAGIMIAAEALATGLLTNICHIPATQLLSLGYARMFCILVAGFGQILLIKVTITAIRRKNHAPDHEPVRLVIPLLLCQAVFIFLAYAIFSISVKSLHYFSAVVLMANIGLIYINIVAFRYFDYIKAAYMYKSRSEAAEYRLGLQHRYINFLREHQQKTDALSHDIKKHLALMKTLIEHGETASAEEYVSSMSKEMAKSMKIVRTGDSVIDVLLTEQHRLADEKGIPYQVDVRLEEKLNMESMDICTILGNLFDNALEACMLIPSGDAVQMRLYIGQRNHALCIIFENTYCAEARKKWHPGHHGTGMKNVRRAVEKYNGSISYTEDGTWFTASIVIP